LLTGVLLLSTSTPVSNTNSSDHTSNTLNTSHSVNLSGLSPDTTHYYIIIATDEENNTATSSGQSFKTDESIDTTDPVISNIILAPDVTEIDISWDTDENTKGAVYVSSTTPVDINTATKLESNTFKIAHSVTSTGLSADTVYYFLIVAEDESGNSTAAAEEQSATNPAPDTTTPVISVLTSSDTTASSSVISFTTDEPASHVLYFSVVTPVDTLTADTKVQAGFVTNHEETLSALAASTTYYFIVKVEDASGNMATSSEESFITL